jgi:hypothetical protein
LSGVAAVVSITACWKAATFTHALLFQRKVETGNHRVRTVARGIQQEIRGHVRRRASVDSTSWFVGPVSVTNINTNTRGEEMDVFVRTFSMGLCHQSEALAA